MSATKTNLFSRLLDRFFGPELHRRINLAVKALDDARDVLWSGGSTNPRDRYDFDRQDVLRDALEAWRLNPLAKRIVSLTSQYVVGGGLAIACKHPASHKFLQDWWDHRQNHIHVRAFDWCDELTRAGNLLVLVSTDQAGMSYVRALPADQVDQIQTQPNDIEQPTLVVEKPGPGEHEGRAWAAYDEATDARQPDGSFKPIVLHYAINRPAAALWGESDLAPLLKWLARYSALLEDRVRLNRFRQMFLFVLRKAFANEAERLTKQAELNANPPSPGSILVVDKSEEWGVMQPVLDSFEAGEDILAIKKLIAAGSGNPLHFLAEPESSTRTTAEAAGGPTFRHYEQRQLYFLWLLRDVATIALRRRAMVDSKVKPDAKLQVTGTDISARDNASLAIAAVSIANAFAQMRDRNIIDDAELLRLTYKFAGEIVDVDDMLARGAKAPKVALPPSNGKKPMKQPDIDPVTGLIKEKAV